MLLAGDILGLGMALLVLGLNSPAFATATSGWKYFASPSMQGSTKDACVRSGIVDVADNRAWAGTAQRNFQANCLGAAVAVPSGWLGARADGYRNGSYCGTTGWYYSGTLTSEFGVGAKICGNPSGAQTFKTVAAGTFWTDSGSYLTSGGYSSPNQTY